MEWMWNDHGIHMESFHGMNMESIWNPGGFHVMIYVMKHIPCGFHMDSME
jgi:hypothetical protein